MDKFGNETGHTEVLVLPAWGIPPEAYWSRLSDHFSSMEVFDYGFFSNDEEPVQRPFPQISEEDFPQIIIGHSFGALPAIRLAAANPEKINMLVLISPFGRFVQGPDYPCGIPLHKIEAIRKQLAENPKATLEKYIAQCICPGNFEILLPDTFNIQALDEGLNYLSKIDLREELYLLNDISVFMFDCAGDQLINAGMSEDFATRSGAVRHTFGLMAGNLYFLENPSDFGTELGEMSGL